LIAGLTKRKQLLVFTPDPKGNPALWMNGLHHVIHPPKGNAHFDQASGESLDQRADGLSINPFSGDPIGKPISRFVGVRRSLNHAFSFFAA